MASAIRTTVEIAAAPLFGLAAIFVLIQLDGVSSTSSFLTALFIEVGVFVIACLLGCLFAPTHPFRAAFLGVAGVFMGIIFDIAIHPTISGGYERNLFPLEIAFHTFVAVPSFIVAAAVWKGGFVFLRRGEKHA
jgi:hypothetical protein